MSGQRRYQYISEDGLLVAIEKYFQLMISANSKTGSSRLQIEEDIKRYEEAIQRNIDIVDHRLKELERK
jgi:hypothetical protein